MRNFASELFSLLIVKTSIIQLTNDEPVILINEYTVNGNIPIGFILYLHNLIPKYGIVLNRFKSMATNWHFEYIRGDSG